MNNYNKIKIKKLLIQDKKLINIIIVPLNKILTVMFRLGMLHDFMSYQRC